MSTFAQRFTASQRLTPLVLDILRERVGRLIVPATDDLDMRGATDLMVFRYGTGGRIAARTRGERYRQRYPHDVTVRLSLPSGTPTELEKFCQGQVGLMFYGFHDDERTAVRGWCLIDVPRLVYNLALPTRHAKLAHVQENPEDGVQFLVVDTRLCIPGVVVDAADPARVTTATIGNTKNTAA